MFEKVDSFIATPKITFEAVYTFGVLIDYSIKMIKDQYLIYPDFSRVRELKFRNIAMLVSLAYKNELQHLLYMHSI